MCDRDHYCGKLAAVAKPSIHSRPIHFFWMAASSLCPARLSFTSHLSHCYYMGCFKISTAQWCWKQQKNKRVYCNTYGNSSVESRDGKKSFFPFNILFVPFESFLPYLFCLSCHIFTYTGSILILKSMGPRFCTEADEHRRLFSGWQLSLFNSVKSG